MQCNEWNFFLLSPENDTPGSQYITPPFTTLYFEWVALCKHWTTLTTLAKVLQTKVKQIMKDEMEKELSVTKYVRPVQHLNSLSF